MIVDSRGKNEVQLTAVGLKQAGATTISIVSSTLHKIDDGVKDEAFTEDVIQNVAGTLYAAGTDTVRCHSLHSMVKDS